MVKIYFQLLIAFLLVLQVLSFSNAKSFTTDLEVVEKDGSAGKVTWNYDARQQSEALVYHRKGGKDTINLRFYTQGIEYLVIEDTCFTLPLSESIPTPAKRISLLSGEKEMIKWSNTKEGPVDPSLFKIPSSCSEEGLKGGIFCPSCLSVSGQVIDLGCNATSSEIANLCGNTFAGICKAVLEQACNGVCQIEQCATDVCCSFDLCSGSTCPNTTSSSSSTTQSSSSSSSSSSSGSSSLNHNSIFDQDESQKGGNKGEEVGGGIFCPSCLSVAGQVIDLGCNATSSEISNLCGSAFGALCKQVLDMLCTGGCNVENCASQTCCAFDLCTGSSCNSTTVASPSPSSPSPSSPFSNPPKDGSVVQIHF